MARVSARRPRAQCDLPAGAIAAFREAMPGVPLVAAFETEFHRTMSGSGPLLRRAGRLVRAAGISPLRLPRRLARVHRRARGRTAGSRQDRPCVPSVATSAAALRSAPLTGGVSVDTTMGFSPAVGPGERHPPRRPRRLRRAFHDGPSTPGRATKCAANWPRPAAWPASPASPAVTSETSPPRPAQGSADAALALDVFTYQVRKTIGAYTVAMGGVDAIAFTGGIGENSPELRASLLPRSRFSRPGAGSRSPMKRAAETAL